MYVALDSVKLVNWQRLKFEMFDGKCNTVDEFVLFKLCRWFTITEVYAIGWRTEQW